MRGYPKEPISCERPSYHADDMLPITLTLLSAAHRSPKVNTFSRKCRHYLNTPRKDSSGVTKSSTDPRGVDCSL